MLLVWDHTRSAAGLELRLPACFLPCLVVSEQAHQISPAFWCGLSLTPRSPDSLVGPLTALMPVAPRVTSGSRPHLGLAPASPRDFP